MANPFHTDASEDAEDDAVVGEIVATDDTDKIEVNLSPAEDDDDDDAPEPMTRQQKRRERGRLRAELDAERQRSAAAEARLAQATGYQQGLYQQQQFQQQAQGDPYDREIAMSYKVHQEIVKEADALSKTMSPEEFEKNYLPGFQRKVQQVEEHRSKNIMLKNQRDLGMTPDNIARQAAFMSFKQENSDIYSDNNLAMELTGVVQQMIARGFPDTRDTAERAANIVRQGRGMIPRGAPTAIEKQRLTGMSASAHGGKGNGHSVVPMDSHAKKMAQSLYPNMSPVEAWKSWAKNAARQK